MNDSPLVVRQSNTCAAPYQFYRCSKGPFVGCCAIDPCNDGICPSEAQPSSTSAGPDDQTTTLTATRTTMSTSSITSTDFLDETTSTLSVVTTTWVTSAGYSVVVTETVGVPTSAGGNNDSSNAVGREGSGPTSSIDKGAIVGGAVGGVFGVMILFLVLFLWYRKRKPSNTSLSLGSHDKKSGKNDSAGLQVNSDYTSSSSWTGPFEHYNDKGASPFRQHVNRTCSSNLSELDSSPISPLTPRNPRTMTSSDTVFELDSINNHKHELEDTQTSIQTPGLSPETPSYPMSSISSRCSEQENRSNYSWNLGSEHDFSRISSGSNGGVRVASAAHSSTKSDTQLGCHG